MMVRRATVLVVTLAVLVLGGWVHKQLPEANDKVFAPYTFTQSAPGFGTVGTPRVTTATELNGVASHGLWLIVEVPFTPDSNEALPRTTLHAADERTFSSSSSYAAACEALYNQAETTCRFAFEVPEDAVEGAHLLMDQGYQQMASVLDVDLQIDVATARELTENVQPREIPEVQV